MQERAMLARIEFESLFRNRPVGMSAMGQLQITGRLSGKKTKTSSVVAATGYRSTNTGLMTSWAATSNA